MNNAKNGVVDNEIGQEISYWGKIIILSLALVWSFLLSTIVHEGKATEILGVFVIFCVFYIASVFVLHGFFGLFNLSQNKYFDHMLNAFCAVLLTFLIIGINHNGDFPYLLPVFVIGCMVFAGITHSSKLGIRRVFVPVLMFWAFLFLSFWACFVPKGSFVYKQGEVVYTKDNIVYAASSGIVSPFSYTKPAEYFPENEGNLNAQQESHGWKIKLDYAYKEKQVLDPDFADEMFELLEAKKHGLVLPQTLFDVAASSPETLKSLIEYYLGWKFEDVTFSVQSITYYK